MEAWMMVIALLGLLLTAGALLAAGVWSVGKITGSVGSLSAKLDGLSAQVHLLTGSLSKVDNKIDGHAERITRLEERHTH